MEALENGPRSFISLCLTSRLPATGARAHTGVRTTLPVAWLRLDWPSGAGPEPGLCRPEAPLRGHHWALRLPPLRRTSKPGREARGRQHTFSCSPSGAGFKPHARWEAHASLPAATAPCGPSAPAGLGRCRRPEHGAPRSASRTLWHPVVPQPPAHRPQPHGSGRGALDCCRPTRVPALEASRVDHIAPSLKERKVRRKHRSTLHLIFPGDERETSDSVPSKKALRPTVPWVPAAWWVAHWARGWGSRRLPAVTPSARFRGVEP